MAGRPHLAHSTRSFSSRPAISAKLMLLRRGDDDVGGRVSGMSGLLAADVPRHGEDSARRRAAGQAQAGLAQRAEAVLQFANGVPEGLPVQHV